MVTPRGIVVGLNIETGLNRPSRRHAVPVVSLDDLLSRVLDMSRQVEPPEPLPVFAPQPDHGTPHPMDAREAPGKPVADRRDPRDYRIRRGETSVELLTPALVDALAERSADPAVMGDHPWNWSRRDAQERVVVVQVVPDLRWTTGSVFRVAGRVVSYPFVVALYPILAVFVVLGDPRMASIYPDMKALWKPARAAYHHKGNFGAMRLYRGGVEIPPLASERLCDKAKVWVRREPAQRGRLRTIRGCWGAAEYPPDAFAPGAPLVIHLFEGSGKGPETLEVDPDLARRVWTDFAADAGAEAP